MVAVRCDPLVDGTIADAVVAGGVLRHLPGSREDGVLVLGCDPAMGLIERMAPPDVRIVTGHATSGDSIVALGDRRCHAAVVHAVDGAPSRLPEAVAQTAIARWRVGIAANVPEDEIVDRLRDGRLSLVCQSPTANAQVAVERWLQARDLHDVRRAGLARDHLEAARMARAERDRERHLRARIAARGPRSGRGRDAPRRRPRPPRHHRGGVGRRRDSDEPALFRARLQSVAGYLPAVR